MITFTAIRVSKTLAATTCFPQDPIENQRQRTTIGAAIKPDSRLIGSIVPLAAAGNLARARALPLDFAESSHAREVGAPAAELKALREKVRWALLVRLL